MPVAWLCDFDGTIAPSDIGAAFVGRFAGNAGPLPELAEWVAGRIGHRELTRAECARLRVGAAEALEFTRNFGLDPAFAPFVRAAEARGDAVMVVSEGFDFYLTDQLARAGLASLPWAANRADFHADGRVTPAFPFEDAACSECGNCKAQHVRAWRGRGYATVLVGDGLSDRHGALAADAVLARGALREWCRSEGVPHRPFESFADVAADAIRREAIGERA